MDFQFLFNPLKHIRMEQPTVLQVEGGSMSKPHIQHTNIKHFQPIVRSKKRRIFS